MDTQGFELRCNGEVVSLEPQVFDLLSFLINNRDKIVSKDEIFAAVWDDRIVSESTLSSRLKDLRKAIGDMGSSQSVIRTSRNRGFRFIAPVEEIQEIKAEITARDLISQAAVVDQHYTMPSIAVLPFVNETGDPSQSYFCDGVTSDIIMLLSRASWLRVTARGSSFYFKDSSLSISEIGEQLSSRYILEGGVQTSDGRIRVRVDLARCEDGQHLWGERYENDVADLFAVQDDIVRKIAAAIDPVIDKQEREDIRSKKPINLNAWESYHRGNWHLFSFTLSALVEAERWFGRAITLDSEMASAYAGLANVHIQQTFYGDVSERQMVMKAALVAARKAVQLADQDAHCHYILSRSLSLNLDHDEAIAVAHDAIELNPSSAHAYFALGWSQVNVGREVEAIENLSKAAEWSPHDPHLSTIYHMQAMAHHRLGQLEDASVLARQSIRQSNATYWPYATLCSILGSMKALDKIEPVKERLLQLRPDYTRFYATQDFFFTIASHYVEHYVAGLEVAGIPA
mgnify:CR=1 FL=1